MGGSAPKRTRTRRIQKKINNRYGAMHYCDEGRFYIHMISNHIYTMLSPMVAEQNQVIAGLNAEMMDVIRATISRSRAGGDE